jgi:hypothetical protein
MIFNHKNEIIVDDDRYGVEVAEICYNKEDLANIDQLIYTQDFATVDQRIYPQRILTDQYDPLLHPSDGPSNVNDETNSTPTTAINQYQ